MIESLTKLALKNNGNILFSNEPLPCLSNNYAMSTPTCSLYKDELVFNSRLVNYKKVIQSKYRQFVDNENNQVYLDMTNGVNSRNVSYKLKNNNFINFNDVDYNRLRKKFINSYYKGLEDCKYVVWGNKLYAYGTRWDIIEGVGCICIYELNDEFEPILEIVTHTNSTCEKNWAAIEDRPFEFIYSVYPTVIVKVDKNTGDCSFNTVKQSRVRLQKGIRGSTPLIRYNDNEYISMVHRTSVEEDNMSNIVYHTMFLCYDNNLQPTRCSNWFVFLGELCEFTCGMVIKDDVAYIPFSLADCTSNLITLPVSALDMFIDRKHDVLVYHPEPNAIFCMADQLETSGHLFASQVLYNYAAVLYDFVDVTETNKRNQETAIKKTWISLATEIERLAKPNTETIENMKMYLDRYNDESWYPIIKGVLNKATHTPMIDTLKTSDQSLMKHINPYYM